MPSVTFLGTRFDNLRIGGHKVEVAAEVWTSLDPGATTIDPILTISEVIDRISAAERYDCHVRKSSRLGQQRSTSKGRPAVNAKGQAGIALWLTVSSELPGISFGHVIDLPHFGRIFLGELKVEREPGNRSKGINDTVQAST